MLHMIKKLVSRLLSGMGYRLQRIDPTALEAYPNPLESYSAPPDEITKVETAMENLHSKNPNNAWGTHQVARKYLSNGRICFFHRVIDICNEIGICFTDRKVADFGACTGYLLRYIHLSDSSAILYGYDTLGDALELAGFICPTANLSISSMFEVQETFDLIFCTEVIEHMVHPDLALAAMRKCLNANGTLFLTVPDGRRDQTAAGHLRDDKSSHWGHVNFWSPESWRIFIEKSFPDAKVIRCGIVGDNKIFAAITVK
jgi:2-polyprenyl-3-methyl-5-hydroxy-6-metoxy-1,4-benzoquinol methylase